MPKVADRKATHNSRRLPLAFSSPVDTSANEQEFHAMAIDNRRSNKSKKGLMYSSTYDEAHGKGRARALPDLHLASAYAEVATVSVDCRPSGRRKTCSNPPPQENVSSSTKSEREQDMHIANELSNNTRPDHRQLQCYRDDSVNRKVVSAHRDLCLGSYLFLLCAQFSWCTLIYLKRRSSSRHVLVVKDCRGTHQKVKLDFGNLRNMEYM